MSTNAKIYFALGLTVVAVFALTVIKMSVPDDIDVKVTADDGGGQADSSGELLRADVEQIFYNPLSDKAVYREYPEYFEQNNHPVPLWFSNPNPVPVELTFLHTSCGACSYADVAVLPAPKVDPTAPPDPFGAVVGGVMGRTPVTPEDAVPLGLDAAAHAERAKLVAAVPADGWQRLVAANSTAPGVGTPGGSFEFPAGSPDKPTYGVLRLNIKVTESKWLEATIGQKKPGMVKPVPVVYKAKVTLVQMCDVHPGGLDVGQLTEGSGPITETVYYFSSTRTTDPAAPPDQRLPRPVLGGLKNDPFLTFGPPEPLGVRERLALADELTARRKTPVRVAGGYKMTMTLSRTAPDPAAPGKVREIDLGPAERKVSVVPETNAGMLETPPTLVVRSVAIGAVTLDGEADGVIKLGSFSTRSGVTKTVKVSTDRPGLELEAVPEMSSPSYLLVPPLAAPETKGARTVWTVQVKVPPGEGGGRLKDGSVITLRIRGTGQLIRLPVTGSGHN
jgi:hypothetical protein